MLKFMMTLGVVMLMAAVLTMQPLRSLADGSIEGTWSAKILSGANADCIGLEVERSSWGHHRLGATRTNSATSRASMPVSPPPRIPPFTSSCAAMLES